MAVNGVQYIDRITVDDLVAEACGWKLRAQDARHAVTTVLEKAAVFLAAPSGRGARPEECDRAPGSASGVRREGDRAPGPAPGGRSVTRLRHTPEVCLG
jgi:hypothetical protein